MKRILRHTTVKMMLIMMMKLTAQFTMPIWIRIFLTMFRYKSLKQNLRSIFTALLLCHPFLLLFGLLNPICSNTFPFVFLSL
jgi:hypothetical protein